MTPSIKTVTSRGLGVLLCAVMAAGAFATEAPSIPDDADSKAAKSALATFKSSFDTPDIDYQMEAIEKLASVQHPTVAKRLIKLLKTDNKHVRQFACEGLGKQLSSARKAGPKLLKLAEDSGEEPKVSAAAVTSLGHLWYKKAEPDLRLLMKHDDDLVVIAVFKVYGEWKDPSALRDMLNFFTKYPDEKEFKTGSVTVDTGSAGNEDQKAAQSKWKAKFGGQRSWRPRPKCTKAMRAALKEITGVGFRRSEDLKSYIDDPEKYRDPEKVMDWMEEPKRRKIYLAWRHAQAKAGDFSEREVPGEEASDERATVYQKEVWRLRGRILERNKIVLSELDVIVEEGEEKKWPRR